MRRVRGLLLPVGLAATLFACRAKDDGRVVHLSGRIEAPLVDLAPKVSGRVVEVLVREGDRVKAGDVLARLDLGETALAVERDREGVRSAEAKYEDLASGSRRPEISAAEAEVSDRRASVALAERELERQNMLLDKKVGTVRDHDRAKTDLERAQAALKSSEERLRLAIEGSRREQTERGPLRRRPREGPAQAVGDGREGGGDPRAGRRRHPAPHGRAGAPARGRPARPDAGLPRPALRAHLHSGDRSSAACGTGQSAAGQRRRVSRARPSRRASPRSRRTPSSRRSRSRRGTSASTWCTRPRSTSWPGGRSRSCPGSRRTSPWTRRAGRDDRGARTRQGLRRSTGR